MEKCTLHLKWCCTVETSVLLEKNLYKIPFFSSRKGRFVRKVQVLSPKTRFSRGKVYFTSEIMFYSGNLSFPRKKLVENPFFFGGKDRFVRKILRTFHEHFTNTR